MKCHTQVWIIKSKGAVLSLVLQFLAIGTFLTIQEVTAEIVPQINVTVSTEHGRFIAGCILMGLACPVAGWLADARVSRYKVVRSGLWLMWFGMLSLTALILFVYSFPQCEWCRICFFVGGFVGCVLGSIGFLAYVVNAVQFGIDQMPDASSEQLSAYIHWFMWASFTGGAIGANSRLINGCVPSLSNGYLAGGIQLFVLTSMLSLALCCEFIFRKWLIIEPECPNSLRMIYEVLKFAATHKYPIRRRAITYTEDEKPSRIDFAKDKYGGPFTTEQVEDVKTFFRVVLVVTSTCLLFAPLALVVTSFNFLLGFPSSTQHCYQMGLTSTYPVTILGVALMPLYMFVLHPLLKSRILSMLQRVSLTAVLTVVLCGAILIINAVKHAQDPDLACMFSGHNLKVLRPELWWAIPFKFTVALGNVVSYSTIVEFTTAQSPYNMRGLLLGLQFSITMFTMPISYGIFTAWRNFKMHVFPSCDFYYFLFQFLCAVVGFIVLCIVARWYKRRRREEEDDQRRIVEEIYDRVLQSRLHNHQREDVLENVSK